MTVRELIAELQKIDPNLHVFVRGYEGGYDDAGPISNVNEIALNVHEEWFYGKHEDADSSYYVRDKDKYTIVKGIIL